MIQELTQQSIWIKDPLAILADGAERGVVVRQGRIVALVPAGAIPAIDDLTVFEAGQHVILPGLINTHHHFYQTLTRALPGAMDRELFPWLQALYPVWARLTPESLHLGVTVAMAELLLSGCTTTTTSEQSSSRRPAPPSTARLDRNYDHGYSRPGTHTSEHVRE
jgi:8-oxoguanine deaminase